MTPGESAQVRAVKSESANARSQKGAPGAPRSLYKPASSSLEQVFRVDEISAQQTGKVEAKAFVRPSMAAARPTRQSRSRVSATPPCSLVRSAVLPMQTKNGDRRAGGAGARKRNRYQRVPASSMLWRPRCRRFSSIRAAGSAIVTYRSQRIAAVTPHDLQALAGTASIVLASSIRFTAIRAADLRSGAAVPCARRALPGADKATVEDDHRCFASPRMVIFSSECLAATTGRADLADALAAVARHSASPAPSVSTAQILKTGMRRTAPLSTNRMSSGPLLTARKAVSEVQALQFSTRWLPASGSTHVASASGMPVRADVAAFAV